MKTLLKTLFLALLLGCSGFGYAQHVQYPATGIITVPRWESPGIPEGWVAPPSSRIVERGAVMPDEIRPKVQGASTKSDDPDANARQDGNLPLNASKVSQGSVVSVGRHFVANNLTQFTPCDNAMAISDSGFIVTADNYTIEYYDETPDTLLQHQTHDVFYGDTSLVRVPFDPKIIYDRYSGRFIVLMLAYADSAANQILLSFSKGQDPRNGWNHYRLNSDTLTNDQWLDFPSMAVNKNELLIAGNMFQDTGSVFASTKMWQIRKREGILGQPLVFKVWTNVLDDDGAPAFTVVPLSDGLMGDNYGRGFYMVSTEFVAFGNSSNKLYWYYLNDSLDAAGVAIETHQAVSSISYSPVQVALQLGSQDQIIISDCRVLSGFYLDGTLNFVYCKGTNNFSTIVLNRLDILTNTNQRFPWGFSSAQMDYCFPSIAFWGSDSTEADNIMVCFQRTSSTTFPEMMAVNFNTGDFAPSSTVLRQGDGFIDSDPFSTLERWGDYTMIQRRYASQQKSCWLAGSYPFGATPNFYGDVNGLTTYVAEIADTGIVSAPSPHLEKTGMIVYPNPSSAKLNVSIMGTGQAISSLELISFDGSICLSQVETHGLTATLDCGELSRGIYLLRVRLNNNSIHYEKVILQ